MLCSQNVKSKCVGSSGHILELLQRQGGHIYSGLSSTRGHVDSTRIGHDLYFVKIWFLRRLIARDRDTFVLNLWRHEGTLARPGIASRIYNCKWIHWPLSVAVKCRSVFGSRIHKNTFFENPCRHPSFTQPKWALNLILWQGTGHLGHRSLKHL